MKRKLALTKHVCAGQSQFIKVELRGIERSNIHARRRLARSELALITRFKVVQTAHPLTCQHATIGTVGGYAYRQSMLTDAERGILDFAELRWRYEGARVSAIRERFGISANVYAMRLGALIERPDALEYAPQLVRRLIRLRDARRSRRVASST